MPAAVALGLAAAWLLTPAAPAIDDPYIALHSADSVLAGRDTTYDAPALSGATSPVYVALLVALRAAGLDALASIRLASATGTMALAGALWLLASALGLGRLSSLLFVPVVLLSGLTWLQATNGLETGWAMAALVGIMAAHLTGRPRLVAAGVGILPWLRPEILPAGVLVLLVTLHRQPSRHIATGVGVALLAAAPWAAWTWLDTGSVVPLTGLAKVQFFAQNCRPVADKLGAVWSGLWFWWVLALPSSLGLLALWRSSLGAVGLAACVAGLGGFAVAMPDAVWHNTQRYLYPVLLPWAAYGTGRAVADAGRLGPFLLVPALAFGLASAVTRTLPLERAATELIEVARWLDTGLPAGTRVLVQDAGAVSVFTDLPLTDIVGLKSASSRDAHRRWTWSSCGRDRGRAIAEIADRSGARYLVTNREWESLFGFVAALRARGVAATPVREPPPDVTNGYTVYRIDGPR